MSKKKYLKNLKVTSPCSEDWAVMTGNEKVRFCSHCDLSVNNLSEMTQSEAKQLVIDSKGRLCVRYIQHPKTQAPVFADKLYKITRQTGIAAGVLGASLAATSMTYAQGGVISRNNKATEKTSIESSESENLRINKKRNELTKGSGKLAGVVTDTAGAVIPNALVTISLRNNIFTAMSDEYGAYTFENLTEGNYLVRINAPGFQEHKVSEVKIDKNTNETLNAQLVPELVTFTMGAVGFVRIIENPLIKAVIDGKPNQVKSLIARGTDVNAKDEGFSSLTALHTAVQENNLNIVQILLNASADVNLLDEDGNTALMLIGENTNVEIVKLLIKYGTNLDVQNKDARRTALINAAMEDNFKAMRVLIEAGANVNLRDEDGDSALDLIDDEKTLQLLIAYGAQENSEDK